MGASISERHLQECRLVWTARRKQGCDDGHEEEECPAADEEEASDSNAPVHRSCEKAQPYEEKQQGDLKEDGEERRDLE